DEEVTSYDFLTMTKQDFRECNMAESATSREQELLKEITFLKEQINKSTHEFDVIVHSRTKKGFKWTINVDHVTLEGLKDTIYNIEGTLTLASNNSATLDFGNGRIKHQPRNNEDFRNMLRQFILQNELKFIVYIKTSKLFNKWTFLKVYKLYELNDVPNPKASRKLFDELETRVATTSIDVSYEATRSIYSYSFLVSATFPFKKQIKIVPEKLVERNNGRGNLDYGNESRTTGRTIANEINDEYNIDKVWRIVTDAESDQDIKVKVEKVL
ncbi:8024_t:CDS:2, partial [Gigaspora rosea]